MTLLSSTSTRPWPGGGFEPELRRRGDRVEIVLHNCPFESTAVDDPDTVCGLHRGIAEGLAERAGRVVVEDLITQDPRKAECRVLLQVEQPD